MKSKSRRKKYAAISSMDELLERQAQLQVLIKKQELELLDDAGRVRELLSFPNLAHTALDALYDRFPMIRNAKVGFRVISSLLTGRRRRSDDCGCDPE